MAVAVAVLVTPAVAMAIAVTMVAVATAAVAAAVVGYRGGGGGGGGGGGSGGGGGGGGGIGGCRIPRGGLLGGLVCATGRVVSSPLLGSGEGGCVGTMGVKPTNMPTEAPTPHKKVSWRDALFPLRTLVDVDS
jgi:hypothetical protein